MSKIDSGLFEKIANDIHAPIKRKFDRRKVFSPALNHIWGSDLIDMQQFKDENQDYAYILVCVDIFSRYAHCLPLKRKTAKEMLEAFESFDDLPKFLWVDQGKEYYNKMMEKFCKDNKITMYSTFGEHKSAVAERFNRTLKMTISKYMTAYNTYEWVDALQEMITKYNNTKHRGIGMTPIEAMMEENTSMLLERQRGTSYSRGTTSNSRGTQSLKVGDRVRISRLKGVFEKGYSANWSEEVFKVVKVLSTEPTTYKITEWDDTPIKGSFYRNELLKTDFHPDLENMRVEGVVKKDPKNRRNLVKFIGWPAKYNSWVSY